MSENARILIVEDDPHLLRATALLLEKVGYVVIEAETGRQGLELAREHVPDLILLDMVLPDIDGIQVCQRIKSEPSLAGCFVVLASNVKTASADQANGLETGADGYIARPISNRELLARVEAMLRIQRTERALRESERVLNTTGRMGQIGGWEHDLATGKAVWTQALYDIVEIPYDQNLPGVDEHLSYYPPKDREILEKAYSQAVESGIPFDLELEGYTANKRPIWCRVQGEPVYKDGQCVAMRGVLQDITERVQSERKKARAEEALCESEKRFRYAMEATSDGLYDWNIQTNDIYYSPTYFTMLGYEPDEFPHTFETYERLLHPEDAKRSAKALAEYLSAGEGESSIEMRFKAKSGEWMWILSRGKIVEYDDEGKPLRFVGTNVDIDARKKAAEAVRFEKERAQQYLGTASVMLVAFDIDGKVTLINPKGCEMLDCPEQEILGQDWFERFLPSENVAEVRRVFEQIISGDVQPVEYFENPIVRGDGSQRIVAWHNSILRDSSGQIIGLFSSGEDITERKRAEEELSKHRERLEELVEERTANLRTMVNSMSGREVRMAELKEVIKKLRAQLEGAGLEPVADDPLFAE